MLKLFLYSCAFVFQAFYLYNGIFDHLFVWWKFRLLQNMLHVFNHGDRLTFPLYSYVHDILKS